jgi:hypothetical protein
MKLQSIIAEMQLVIESGTPVEIGDLVKNFPNTHTKALKQLWGGKRLVYKGKTLFDHDDFGPAYRGAIKAAEKVKRSGLSLNFSFRSAETESDVEITDMQEVYLGYDEKQDKLYIGFDAWLDDDVIETVFDKLYREAEDEEFDTDSNDPKYENAWREFKRTSGATFWGILFELTSTDGENFKAEVVHNEPNGFYKGIYRSRVFKTMKLIDLRLD